MIIPAADRSLPPLLFFLCWTLLLLVAQPQTVGATGARLRILREGKEDTHGVVCGLDVESDYFSPMHSTMSEGGAMWFWGRGERGD